MRDMNTPYVSVESVSGAREIPLSVLHRTNRNIFLNGEINQEMSEDFLMQMIYYEQEDPDKPVNIYMNSLGGHVQAGLTMLDIIKRTKLTVHMICYGIAYSMAAILMAAGQPGRRYAYEHAQFMIHEPLLTKGVGGSASNIRELSENIMKTRDMLNGMLAEYTGRSIEEINKATGFDNYMSPEDAIDFGLIDDVLDRISI